MKDVHRIHNQRDIRRILSRHKGGSLHHPERIIPCRTLPTGKGFFVQSPYIRLTTAVP